MRNFIDWFHDEEVEKDEPWLVIGKGPTFRRLGSVDVSEFRTFGLNHVVREAKVLVAHAIDLEVVEQCAREIPAHASYLLLPWIPHINHRPGPRTLDDLSDRIEILAELRRQDRLLWYNLGSKRLRERLGLPLRTVPGYPVVEARYFSAEAALGILAGSGVRHVRTLGIDGGAAYSHEFSDLTSTTLLSNGRSDFDLQFRQIARIIMSSAMDVAPLEVESPIRVYVGSTGAQMLPVKVLEYSIRKHASMSVEVFPLHLSDIDVPMPRDPANRPRTPFSFQRFMIPELAGFRGRAIYVDSDMQVFADLRRLWTLPLEGADLLAVGDPESDDRRPQFSVMLLDCAALGWSLPDLVAALDRGELNYETLMYEMRAAKQIRADIEPEWNSLEKYEPGRTALLHYTDMQTQPWVSTANPLGYLWTRDLLEAIDEGFVSIDFVREEVERAHVRPSLLFQLEHRIESEALLPREARDLDRGFVPPYRTMPTFTGSPLRHPLRFVRAALGHYARNNPIGRGLARVRQRLLS